jgi:peptide/nickel transport system ATP-binding protein
LEVLRVERLTVDYRTAAGPVHALRDVSLSIRQGEILGLVGESGSGKTTLALAVSRLLRTPPAIQRGGKIIFGGKDITRLGASETDYLRGTGIFMVFQDPFQSLNPLMKVKDQLVEAISVRSRRDSRRLDRHDAEAEAVAHLKTVRIGDAKEIAERYPHEISGGQNQRVMLAMALAERPSLLIADEPVTALDVTTQAQILLVFKEIVRATGMAVLFVTHDLAVAGVICNRVAVLYGGMVQEAGPIGAVLSNPKHPYTTGLINSVPSRTKREGSLVAIRGSYNAEGLDSICAFAPRCPLVHDACWKGIPALNDAGGTDVRCLNYGENYEPR